MLHFRHSPAMQKLRSRIGISKNQWTIKLKFQKINKLFCFQLFQVFPKLSDEKSPKFRGVSTSNRNEMDQLACQIQACIKRFGCKFRFGDLNPFANSKDRKRARSRHLYVKGAGLSLRLACKFSNGKSASHHVKKTKAYWNIKAGGRDRTASGPRQGRIV